MEIILIVEDIESNYMLLQAYLDEYGMVSLIAKNGFEALDFVQSNSNIKLVLMDLNMPEMDGIYATKLIKALRPDLTVIAQTAYPNNNVQKEFEKYGFSAFLTKPFTQDQLWKKIEPFLKPSK